MRTQAELGNVGLADDDRAGGAHPPHVQFVGRRDLVGEDRRALRGGEPAGIGEVLHRDRETVHPPRVVAAVELLVTLPGLVDELGLVGAGHDRVHRRVEPIDVPEVGLQHLDAGDLPAADQPRQLDGVQ